MENIDIYIKIPRWNFWFGYYQLTALTYWQDIILYKKNAKKFKKIAEFTLCSFNYFECETEYLSEDDSGDPNYLEKVNEYINHSANIFCNYIYDDPTDPDFYEVPFEAKRNEKGVKPSYIELWHPALEIDLYVLKESAIVFCRDFLKINPLKMCWKKKHSLEETVNEFLKNHEEPKDIIFTDRLVQELAKEWNKTEEEVLYLFNKIVKK